MTSFKSEFLNIMHERGFYNQCTNEQGFDEYLADCEKKGMPAVGVFGVGSDRRQPACGAYSTSDDAALVPKMRT